MLHATECVIGCDTALLTVFLLYLTGLHDLYGMNDKRYTPHDFYIHDLYTWAAPHDLDTWAAPQK